MKKYFLIFFILCSVIVNAQKKGSVKKPMQPRDAATKDSTSDPAYYSSYYKLITGRIYFSQKYTRLTLVNDKDKYDLSYIPNTTLNFGVGATYKWATLNLAYGFPFLNPDDGRGKTKYLDLQAHFYGRKYIIDLFGQFYKGFYLSPQGKLAPTQNQYYIRPDLSVNEIGSSVQYVFNHKRFSYRASFLQSEWQRKSAGSLIAGAEIHGGWLLGDSSIVSSEVPTASPIERISKFNYFEIGPNVGYAYTLVIHKHFFLTGSLAISIDYGTNTSHDFDSKVKSNGFSVNNIFRIFAGYNASWNAFSITFINSDVSLTNKKNNTTIDLNTGNIRVNYIHRFKPGARARRMLKHI